MRRTLAAQTSFAVLLWFFTTPFLHLHGAEAEDHHHEEEAGHGHDSIIHAHLPDHHASGHDVEISEADEDEKPLDSFALLQKYVPNLSSPFLIAARFELARVIPVPTEQVVVPFTPKAHGPPSLGKTNPRAPPV